MLNEQEVQVCDLAPPTAFTKLYSWRKLREAMRNEDAMKNYRWVHNY
jgi:hypothetical protein